MKEKLVAAKKKVEKVLYIRKMSYSKEKKPQFYDKIVEATKQKKINVQDDEEYSFNEYKDDSPKMSAPSRGQKPKDVAKAEFKVDL